MEPPPAPVVRPPVVVVGLGLIGGSLARDLTALGHHVLAFDRDAEALAAAHAEGVVSPWRLAAAPVPDGAIVVLALPVDALIEFLESHVLQLRTAAWITDVGSTKVGVVEAAERAGLGERFVGGHPLAGDHLSGWAASRAGLFDGAPVYLCAARSATPNVCEQARTFWASLGAHPQMLQAELHDARLAWTSHLPQLTATALATTLADAGIDVGDLGQGGRDTLRLAGSSPEMWAAIARANATELRPALAALEARLAEVRTSLESGEPSLVEKWFRLSQRWAQTGGASEDL
jgi:prephenate dehydrogenase